MTITDVQISQVRAQAEADGDDAMVRWCDLTHHPEQDESRQRKARTVVAQRWNAQHPEE